MIVLSINVSNGICWTPLFERQRMNIKRGKMLRTRLKAAICLTTSRLLLSKFGTLMLSAVNSSSSEQVVYPLRISIGFQIGIVYFVQSITQIISALVSNTRMILFSFLYSCFIWGVTSFRINHYPPIWYTFTEPVLAWNIQKFDRLWLS